MSSTTTIPLKKPLDLKKLLSGSLLIAGTSVGAGMLGIPAVTIESGFIPGVLSSFMVWAFMLITGLLLLEVAIKMPQSSNILSITKHYLGNAGRYFAGGMFIFLYYCLIVAYIAGGSPLLAGLMPQSTPLSMQYVVFSCIIGTVVYCGVKWVDKVNILLSLLMLLFFAFMFFGGSSAVTTSRLTEPAQYSKLFLAVPILFGAFGYHNVVPTLCDYLERDKKVLRLSLIVGTLLAMCIYTTWQYLIIGSIDSAVLKQAVAEGRTVISALEHATGNPSLFLFGKWFGALALVTSVLGVSLSMVDFFKDGFNLFSVKTKRLLPCLMTFVPPLIFTLFNPHVFTKALGVAGGIGESIINGLLPISLLWAYKFYKKENTDEAPLYKGFLIFLFILGLGAVGIEIFDLMN